MALSGILVSLHGGSEHAWVFELCLWTTLRQNQEMETCVVRLNGRRMNIRGNLQAAALRPRVSSPSKRQTNSTVKLSVIRLPRPLDVVFDMWELMAANGQRPDAEVEYCVIDRLHGASCPSPRRGAASLFVILRGCYYVIMPATQGSRGERCCGAERRP